MDESLVSVDRENERFIVKVNHADETGNCIVEFDSMSTPELLLGWMRCFCDLPQVSVALISDLIVVYSGVFSDAARANTPLVKEIGYLFSCGESMTIEQLRSRIVADCRKFEVPETNKLMQRDVTVRENSPHR